MVAKSDTTVPEYQRVQKQFASYIRDPSSNALPAGVEQRRMDIYKRLFFNNIATFCTKTFKSFRPFVDDTEWNALIRDFMREYACTSPYFKDIPFALIEYLSSAGRVIEKYPFMREMCHLDAVRMQLRLAPDAPECKGLEITDQTTSLWLSPTVRLLSYEWPVQKLTPATWSGAKPKLPTWLVAFRDRNDQVDVLVLNAHTFRLLEILNDPTTLSELSTHLSREFKVAQNVLYKKLPTAIHSLQKKRILITLTQE